MTYIVSKLTFDRWGNIRLDERSTEAIPIEWIERKLAEHWYVDYDVRELLADWEKENETN